MKDIIENYKHIVFNKYAAFEGRAARPEFWYFVLANILISIILGFIEGILTASLGLPRGMRDDSVLGNIYSLLVLVPSIAVGLRRMHDINRSGWWILLPLYNIYLAAQKGTEGSNRFDAATASPAPVPAATSTETTPIPPATPVSEQPQ